MNPKEKALELKQKFGIATMFSKDNNGYTLSEEMATKMAIIAVDEIINSNPLEPNCVDWDDCGSTHKYWYEAQREEALNFWQQVKNELSK